MGVRKMYLNPAKMSLTNASTFLCGASPISLIRPVKITDADIRAAEFEPKANGCSFLLEGSPVELNVPGRHNVSNALAAIRSAAQWG